MTKKYFDLQLFADTKKFTLSDFSEDGKLEVKSLKAGEKVIIQVGDSEDAVDTFVAGADGNLVFSKDTYFDNGRTYVGLISGTIKLEKQIEDEAYPGGYNVQRAYLYSVHEDTENGTSVDGSMLIGNNSNQDLTVAVKDGIVMSVRGLGGEHGKGTFFEEKFTAANLNNAIRYIVTDETGRIIRQTTGLFDKDWNYKEVYASYTILDNVGDEIVGATYYEKDSETMPVDWNEKINAAMSSVIDEDKDPVGAIDKAEGPFQLKWDEKSVGLFKVNVSKNKVLEAVIDAQTKENNGDKKDLTPKAGTYYWMKVGVKVDADGKEMLVIVPKVRQVTANGTYNDLDLGTNHGWSDKSSVTINAPAHRGINFVNNLNTKVVLNNVAAGSIIKGICIGDKINTTSLKAGDAISFEYTVGDNKYTYTYTAAGVGPLVFQGAGKKYKDENGKELEFRGAALVSGTVKLAGMSEDAHDCTRATCAGPVASDAKQDFVVQNWSKSDIVVTAANGKVSSITGLKGDGYVRVYESNGKMTDYTFVDGEVPVIKRETFDLDEKEEPISDSVVTEICKVNQPEGMNLRNVGYTKVAYTKITGLDFTNNGTTAAYYSLAVSGDDSHGGNANEHTKVTKESVTPDSKDPGLAGEVINEDYFLAKAGEAYLKVTANTAEQVTTLQVDVMYAKDNGELKASPEPWNGRLSLTGIKNAVAAAYADKYAVLKYAKPKNAKWNLSIENAALGSNITGLGANDYIDTAATGDKAVTLKKGTYDIYQTKKDDNGQAVGMETRTLNVEGSVDVKVDENGQVTSLSGLEKGEKVTLSEKTADGQKTVSYEYVGNAYIKTEVLTDSRNKATTTQYKTEEAVIGTDVMTIKNDAWKAVEKGVVTGKVTLKAMQDGDVSHVICAGANENDATDNIVIMNYSAKDDVTVNVARGKVTSITGLKSEDNYIIVREGAVDIRYTCLGENGNVFKKEIGTYDETVEGLFVPSKDFKDTTYMQTTKGGNIYTNTYVVGKWTQLTDLTFDKAGKTTAYYSRGEAGVVKITADTFGESATNKGRRGPVRTDEKGTFFGAVSTEAYLSVTATTDRNLVSTVTVDVLRASADGVLKSVREGWSGAVEINGLMNESAAGYDKKYAVLKYTKPVNYKAGVYEGHIGNAIHIENAALGSVFTGYNQYDYIETAATGDEEVNLKQGAYNIYHTEKNGNENVIQVRNVAVTGTVNVKTNEAGQLTYLSEVYNTRSKKYDTYKVTMKEGNVTTTYEFTSKNTYVKTITEVGGPTLQYTAESLKDGYTTLNMDSDGDTILKVTGAKAGSTYDLGAGDTLTTANLKIGDQITVNGVIYTAAAAGSLAFNAVKADGEEKVQLMTGTVKVAAVSEEGVISQLGCADRTLVNSSRDDVTVKVTNGKVTSITGLKSEDDFIIVREGDKDIRYTCLGENGNVFKKEIGTYDEGGEGLFVPSTEAKDTTYMQTTKGGNIYTTAYVVGKGTKLTDLTLGKAGTFTAYYSRGEAGAVKITEDTFNESATDKGLRGRIWNDPKGNKLFGAVSTEAYLSVTATTDRNLVSTIKVDVLRASADGVLKSVREGWGGAVEINGLITEEDVAYDKKYAVLKYTKPANYKAVIYEGHLGNGLRIENAALGSVFTGYNTYDYIETAATGDEAVTLKQGNYNIYHTETDGEKNEIQVRNLAVTGTVNVKTNEAGQLTYLGEVLNAKTNKFDTYKVTMKEGKLTTTYEFTRQGTYVKTITEVGGPTLQYTAKSLKNGYTTLNMDTDGDTILKVTGAKAGATYDLGAGDTLTTANLKIGDQITVNGVIYTAAVAGSLAFDTVQADGEVKIQLTAGTAKLEMNQSILVCGKEIGCNSGDITVMASGKNYTIGGLVEGASFSVSDKDSTLVYTKVGNNLVTQKDDGVVLYSIGKTITSANLGNNNVWKKTETAEDKYGKASIDLAMADKNVTNGVANYVLDKYVVKTPRPNKNAIRNATVTMNGVSGYQDEVGTVTVDADKRTYASTSPYGQIIKVTDKWTVKAGDGDDNITGALKGEDTIDAGAGKNTIDLKAATDTVIIGAGHDEIKGYDFVKDKLVLNTDEEPHFIVDKNDLYITADNVEKIDTVTPNYYAVVRGGANGKAVNVNGKDYYFGKNINATGSHNGVSVKSMNTGLTFTGSKYDDVIDLTASDKTRDYITTGIKQGNDVVKGFGVNDVIKLNGLTKADIAELKNMTNDELTSALAAGLTFKDGGKLTVSTNTGVKVKFQNNTLVSTK